ncbi:hypothetical protein V6C53_01110 [Desulfocurvibacter africanus]
MRLAAGIKSIFADLRGNKNTMARLTEQDISALIRRYINRHLELD